MSMETNAPTAGAGRAGSQAAGRQSVGGQAGLEPLSTSLRRAAAVAGAYVMLMKPSIVSLVLVTAASALFLAQEGLPPAGLVLWTLLGTGLAAGSANALNCYLDRDIDAIMTRTRRRPIPSHRVSPGHAFWFGVATGVAGTALLAWKVNSLSAGIAAFALLFYVLIYTAVLKRRTPQNIVIGGAAGAVGPLIGWAAVTGGVPAAAWILFALVVLWTPPHFWALAVLRVEDYRKAGVPMLPVVSGIEATARQIWVYTVLLTAASLALLLPGMPGGWLYGVAALALGLRFVALANRLLRRTRRVQAAGDADPHGAGIKPAAGQLFGYSITYLGALSLALVIDRLLL